MKRSAPDRRTGVNFDPREKPRRLANKPCGKVSAVLIEGVGDAVKHQRVKAE